MASRAELLNDPRSGARQGAGRAGSRPAPDQRSRDDLAAARARRKPAPRRPRNTSPDDDDTRPIPRAAPRRRARPPAEPDDTAELPAVDDDQADDDEDRGQEPKQEPAAGPARSFTTEGSGAFLALFVYPLVVNYLRGGMPRMTGWVKAKFINQPYASSAPGQRSSALTRGQATSPSTGAGTLPHGLVSVKR